MGRNCACCVRKWRLERVLCRIRNRLLEDHTHDCHQFHCLARRQKLTGCLEIILYLQYRKTRYYLSLSEDLVLLKAQTANKSKATEKYVGKNTRGSRRLDWWSINNTASSSSVAPSSPTIVHEHPSAETTSGMLMRMMVMNHTTSIWCTVIMRRRLIVSVHNKLRYRCGSFALRGPSSCQCWTTGRGPNERASCLPSTTPIRIGHDCYRCLTLTSPKVQCCRDIA